MTLVVEKPSRGPAHVADENIPGRALCGQDVNVYYVIPGTRRHRYSRCPACQARAAELAAQPRTAATV